MSVIDRERILPGLGRAISRVSAAHAAYVEYFDHPFLFALFPAAAVAAVLGVAFQLVGWAWGAGFMALFAVKFVALSTLGYASMHGLDAGQRLVERYRVERAEHESASAALRAALLRRGD